MKNKKFTANMSAEFALFSGYIIPLRTALLGIYLRRNLSRTRKNTDSVSMTYWEKKKYMFV
jgi:hypothetical protein